MTRIACLMLSLVCWVAVARAEQLPIFDAHIHYSHDAVEFLPPKEAIKALRAAGLKKGILLPLPSRPEWRPPRAR